MGGDLRLTEGMSVFCNNEIGENTIIGVLWNLKIKRPPIELL